MLWIPCWVRVHTFERSPLPPLEARQLHCPAPARPQPAPDDSGLEFLLVGLQSPINIGMILRVAETYRCRVSIYDLHRILDDPMKFRTITDFACGAVTRWGFRGLADDAELDPSPAMTASPTTLSRAPVRS